MVGKVSRISKEISPECVSCKNEGGSWDLRSGTTKGVIQKLAHRYLYGRTGRSNRGALG